MALVLDAGALIAIERHDRATIARLVRAHEDAEPILTSAAAVAQVIRDRSRQVTLERILGGVDERALDSDTARRVGSLLASSHTSDVVDAAVALLAAPGDELMTSDPRDFRALLPQRSVTVTIV